MRKISFIAALVVAMTAVSCTKEINNETPEVNDGAVTFEATFGAVSKAVLEPGATESKVAWEADDQVSVLAGEGNFLYAAASAGYSTTLSTEATDVPAEGPYYAVFPYDAYAVLAEGVITTTLPAVQTAVLGSFTTHLAVAQAAENKLAFKNVCGLVKVTVDAENVTKIVLEGNNGEIVAGGINVTVADAPTWASVAEQGATSVTLAPAAGTLAKGAYYFAVLPQTFTKGFNVKAYKGDEAFVLRNVATEYTLERADIVGSKAFGIDGSGTEADPYILKTPQDMVDMRSLAKLGGETWFKMANDIDLKGINWVPVNAVNSENFNRKIHFDGGDFTISNLTSDKSVHGSDYPSLMGVVYGSVKNLKVDNAVIKSTSGCGVIGGYVGTSGKDGLVENVTVTNSSVTNSGDRAGGICGTARQATFKNVSFQGTVTSTIANDVAESGGFVGQTMSEVTCTDCSVDATVTAENGIVGGFAGYVYDGVLTIENSTVAGSVKAGSSVGGFIAEQAASSTVNVSSSSSSATVTAGNFSGGFLGRMNGVVTLTDCSVSGDVTAASSVGGFAAWFAKGCTATLTRCSASGNVSAKTNIGGIVGIVEDGAAGIFSMTGCHYTGNEFKVNGTAGGLIGYLNGQWTIADCYVETDITGAAGNVGGLIGSVVANGDGNNTILNISNCHYSGDLEAAGSYVGGCIARINGTAKSVTISDIYSTGSVKASQYVGGVIGAAMCTSTQTMTDSWSSSTVTGSNTKIGGFIGAITTPMTVTDCYATGKVINSAQGTGGLVGSVNASVTIEGCYATGDVESSGSHTGALVGESTAEINISKCYSTGSVTSNGNRVAGIIGYPSAKCTIENCYSTGNVSGTGQQRGGVIGYVSAEVSVTNCFASGNVGTGRGSAGIVGNSQASEGQTTVVGCIAWNKEVTTTGRTSSNYAPAAVVGSCYNAGTFKNCWRRSDMVLADNINTSVLYDMDDYENAQLPIPTSVTGNYNRSYHGKAAAADATISSVAKTIGWDEDVWDLSKDVPVLK